MDAEDQNRSALLRFFDAFLSETSIRWVLGVGCATVLGCSIMLVAQYWDEATSAIKQMIMLGYTLLLFATGWWAHEKRGLPRTGCFLLGTTVCLLPVVTAAMQWIDDVGLGAVEGGLLRLLLLGFSAAASIVVSAKAFRVLFRGHLPRYLISYWGLGLAGAMGAAIPEAAHPLALLLSFALLVLGVRSADHWFYWSEDSGYRPAVSPAFPSLLLGGQFLACFSLWFFASLPTAWVGFVCTSLALPILMSTSERLTWLSRRDGALPIPWPASVSLPLLVAVLCAIAGMVMALSALSSGLGLSAISPTALIIAIMAGTLAVRTQSKVLVWATLGATALAYNFAGVFVRDGLILLSQNVAQHLGEDRLPVAYYGVTWLPLLFSMAGVSRWLKRRDESLFSAPLQQFVVGAATVLLALSMTHEKAWFPVGLSLTVAFSAAVRGFCRPRLIIQACVAWFVAMLGVQAFTRSVMDFECGLELPIGLSALVGWGVGATTVAQQRRASPLSGKGLLLAPGLALAVFCMSAALSAQILHLMWLVAISGGADAQDLLTQCGLGVASATGCLFAGWISREQSLVSFALVGAEIAAMLLALLAGLSIEQLMMFAAPSLVLQWFVMSRVSSAPRSTLRSMMAKPLMNFANVGLMIATPTVVLCWLRGVVAPDSAQPEVQTLIEAGSLVFWLAQIGRRRRSQAAGLALCLVAYLSLVAVAAESILTPEGARAIDPQRLLLFCTILASTVLFGIARYERGRSAQYSRAVWADICTHTTDVCAWGWWTPAAVLSAAVALLTFASGILCPSWMTLAAAVIAAVALACRSSFPWLSIGAAANLLAIPAIHLGLAHSDFSWSALLHSEAWQLPLFSFMTAGSALVWGILRTRSSSLKAQSANWPMTFELMSMLALGLTFASLHPVGQTGLAEFHERLVPMLPFGLVAFAVLAASRAVEAMNSGRERCVYQALTFVGVGGLWGHTLNVVNLNSGLGILGSAIAAFLLTFVSRRLEGKAKNLQVFRGPLKASAWGLVYAVPILVSGQRLGFQGHRFLVLDHAGLFLSAMFCFNAWFTERRLWQILSSAFILNLASALVAVDLGFNDPQFFCIPIGLTIIGLSRILGDQFEERTRNQLSYLGALLILVSPALCGFAGSWSHMFVLLVVSTFMVLLGIGLRVRALLFAGSAALAADLCAMIIHGSIDNPSLLWICGIALGLSVTALGAFAERNRESLILRLRSFSAALKAWN